MRLRIEPDAEKELAEAAEWYEARRDDEVVVVLAIAHASRRPGYWVGRSPT